MEGEACLRAGGSRGMDVRTEARLRPGSPDLPSIGVFIYRLSLRWGCAVSQVVKTAQSRGRTERTLLFAGALAGRMNAAGRLDPSLPMSHYCLLHPTHHAEER